MTKAVSASAAIGAGADYARLIKQNPENAGAWHGLGMSCLALGRYPDAVRAFKAQLALVPDDAGAWSALGQALYLMRDAANALKAFSKPLPASLPLSGLLGKGHALRALGHLDAAAESYRAALAKAPDNEPAWWSLANIKANVISDAELDRLRNLASKDSSSAGLHYALGRALDDRQDFAAAFAAFDTGARLWRNGHPYDRDKDRQLARTLASTLAPVQDASHLSCDQDLPRPVFIVGMPRSGSTLLETILAASPQVAAADEPPFLGQVIAELGSYPATLVDSPATSLKDAGTAYLKRLATLSHGKPVVIDKNPNNFWFVPFILRALPHARIIDMRREAMDACSSAYTHLFPRGFDFSYDFADLAAYRHAYVELMDAMRLSAPERIALVDYEQLVADPQTICSAVFAHCDLPWDATYLDHRSRIGPVHTPSAEQVRRPITAGNIGRWRRFGSELAPMADLLSGSA